MRTQSRGVGMLGIRMWDGGVMIGIGNIVATLGVITETDGLMSAANGCPKQKGVSINDLSV